MKTNCLLLKPLAVALVLGLGLSACQKEEETTPPDYTSQANESQKDTFADMAFSEAHTFADEAARLGTVNARLAGTERVLPGCATVTHDTVATPHVITIDFGPTNCQGNDGRYRRGKILVTYTGGYRQPGTVISIGFDDYFVNNHQLLGTKTITNQGVNTVTNYLTYSIVVNGQVNFATGDSATWQANRTRQWVNGANTITLADDIYHLTGQSSGVRANGQAYNTTILEPLVRIMSPNCRRYFVSGKLNIVPASHPVRLLDYGNGACDNMATVTINGNTYPIQLP